MATSKTDVKITGSFSRTWDVTATADADTTITIPHGLSGVTGATANLSLVPLSPVSVLSSWWLDSINGTNLVLSKDVVVGSGAPTPQLRVHLWVNHSIVD